MKLKNPKDFWSGVMFASIGFAFAIIVKYYEYPMGTGSRMGQVTSRLCLASSWAFLAS